MMFHVVDDSKNDEKFSKNQIQFIMFLNKRLLFVETKYWFTKFEMTGVIWVVKKIRHFIKSCKKPPVSVFTNHAIIFGILSRIFWIEINTNKLNLRLVSVFQFVFTFSIRIKIQSKKFHVVFDALFCLKSTAITKNMFILKNLNDVKSMNVKSIIVDSMMIMTFIRKEKPSWSIKFYYSHEILNCQFDEEISFLEMSKRFFTNLKKTYVNDDQLIRLKAKLIIRINFTNI